MIYPYLEETTKDSEMISSFNGLCQKAVIDDSMFRSMKNLTSDYYPMMAARPARGTTALTGGIGAMQICNTYGTKGDIGSSSLNEDIFALVSEGDSGAVLSFKDINGNEVLSPTTIGGEAKETTLIAQAGYVYAFPQGYRRACYASGESKILSMETVTKRVANEDKNGLSGSAYFEMRPSDENGVADGGSLTSYTATKLYDTAGSSVTRGTNDLVIVNANGLAVNAHGTTVKVNAEGKITERYYGKAETISIPDGGYALTGHGAASTWLTNNCVIGYRVAIDGMRVSIFATGDNSVVYEKPETPFNGLKWYDKATGKKYVYSTAQGMWTAYTANYILFTYTEGGSAGDYESLFDVTYNGEKKNDNSGKELRNPFDGFKEGDAIKISGFTEEQDSTYVIAAFANGGVVLNGIVDDIVKKYLSNEGDAVTISRKVPKMDFVIECNNRLWGCYYGVNEKGEVINEIYASALGDPTNWYRYQGISTDSWTATVGADGPFTGAIQYGGYPLFFKENTIIRVYGTAPSSFQTAAYNYRGVQQGSHKSLAICDEVLYYLSNDGVMAYSGSVPQKASDALGNERYCEGVGGSYGSKYYLSCKDSSKNAHLFVFDSRYGVWMEEDSLSAEQFLRHKTELYILTDGRIITATGEGETVEFEATTGEWGLSNPYRKYFDKIIVRAFVPTGAQLDVYYSYDNKDFNPVKTINEGETIVAEICDIPNRCDSIRLKFKGEGECKIVSVYREISGGGTYVY